MTEEEFDYAVLAVGQYSDRENELGIPGLEQFKGRVTNTRDIKDLAEFSGKEVVVVGNGKTSLDMTVYAVFQLIVFVGKSSAYVFNE